KAAQSEQALGAVARAAADNGGQGSILDMLSEILKPLMMEVAMVPTAPAVRSQFQTVSLEGKPDTSRGPVFLANYFVKPQFLFGLPPSCNVFFPSQISTYGYSENYVTQPTRMYFNDDAVLSLLQGGDAGLRNMMQDVLC